MRFVHALLARLSGLFSDENLREPRGSASLESVAADLRYALRTLRRSPAFTRNAWRVGV